jgi:hypothetical protein
VTDSGISPWPHGSEDAIGQAGEFLVWAALVAQSGGGLHVFLPMLDRGIDGLIHRLEDGAYLALQVKAKSSLHSDEAPIAVYENHLFTDDQLVVGVQLDGGLLGAYALVADAATFRRKAGRMLDRGRVRLVADMPTRPIAGHLSRHPAPFWWPSHGSFRSSDFTRRACSSPPSNCRRSRARAAQTTSCISALTEAPNRADLMPIAFRWNR